MTAYQQGETITVKAYLYNENDVLTNADTVVITIKDIEGIIIVDEQNMTHDSTGKYLYDYDSDSNASIGLWKVIVKATLDSKFSIQNDSFRIVL